MIINDNNKYIFVHIPKNAGHSITRTLRNVHSVQHDTHDTAIQVRNAMGDVYFDYFRFAFVRNPWGRLYSLYSFLCQKTMRSASGENWNQQEYIDRGFKWWLMDNEWWPPFDVTHKDTLPPHQKKNQLDWLQDNDGTMLVNFIGRHETLNDDYCTICKSINLPFTRVPHTNASKHKAYEAAYDQEMIDFVAHHHQRDIDMFDYTFGDR